MLARTPPAPSVLELGCGSGNVVARFFIERGCIFTGIDASPAMVRLSGARFPAAEWIAADMRGLNLARKFDALIAWDSFFHLTMDEQRSMFSVFGAHVAPQGTLLFTSGPQAGEATGTLYGEPLFHASLAPDEYRALLTAHGFAVLAFNPEDEHCGGHTVWLAARNDG